MEVVRIMDDPDYTVQRMSDLNAHVQRQRIEDAQTLAACVGAKMWIHNEPTGMRLEFRKDDAVCRVVRFCRIAPSSGRTSVC